LPDTEIDSASSTAKVSGYAAFFLKGEGAVIGAAARFGRAAACAKAEEARARGRIAVEDQFGPFHIFGFAF
jgi:hypothetical protein